EPAGEKEVPLVHPRSLGPIRSYPLEGWGTANPSPPPAISKRREGIRPVRGSHGGGGEIEQKESTMTNGLEVVKSGGALRRGLLFALLLLATAWAVPARAHDRGRPAVAAGGPCTTTAATLYGGCLHQVEADGAVASAICINISDAAERGACHRDADAAQDDGEALCRDQLAGRRDACVLLGDVRYDPDPEPADFETDFAHLAHPNRYFPLRPGNRWVYGGSEDDVVEMTTATKSIDDLTCLVSHDTVREN